jgi:hypothetical protein
MYQAKFLSTLGTKMTTQEKYCLIELDVCNKLRNIIKPVDDAIYRYKVITGGPSNPESIIDTIIDRMAYFSIRVITQRTIISHLREHYPNLREPSQLNRR